MKKTIWILNHYAGGMFFECGGRHYSFAKYLKRDGYNPVVFCSNAKHSEAALFCENDELWQERIAEDIDVPFVFVRSRVYTGNGKQRVLNMLDFYFNVQKTAKEYAKTHGKPDVILASSVHPLTIAAGIKLAKSFEIRCIGEVRDLWPESLVAYGIIGQHNPLLKLLYAGEKWLYKKADKLIFTMEGGKDYIVDKGWDIEHGGAVDLSKVYYINNGVDLEAFDYNRDHYTIDDADLNDESLFKVVYTGSIRDANHIGILVETADILRNRRCNNVRFLVYGDGEKRKELEEEAQQRNSNTIKFKGKVDKKYIPFILSKSNLNILNYRDANGTWKYGGSQNKLFEYFASGKPVLSNIKMNYSLIDRYNCGISENIRTPDEYANAIQTLIDMPNDKYEQMKRNARNAVLEFGFQYLTKRLISVIEA